MHAVEYDKEYADNDEEMFIGTIKIKNIGAFEKANSDNDRWTEELIINEKKVRFRIDTGADSNVLSAKTFQSLKLDKELHASHCKLGEYSCHRMELLGNTSLTCQYKGKNTK